MRACKHCEIEFDLDSPAKKRAGGRINECADCVEELQTETAVKYLGVQINDDPENTLSIVSFDSEEDRLECSSSLVDPKGLGHKKIKETDVSQDKEEEPVGTS